VENSSPSPTSPASPIVFAPNAFSPASTILTVLGGVIILFGIVIIGGVVWITLHGFDPAALQKSLLGLFGIELQSVAEIALVLFLLAVLPAISKTSLRDLGFRAPDPADTGKIVAAIIGMFVLVTALGSLLSAALHFKTQELAVQVFLHMHGLDKALFAIFAVVVGPVTEEFVFRIFLFNAMRKWWGFWPAAIISSILFGLAHGQQPFTLTMLVSLSLPLAIGGIILCSIYVRTGSAWSNIITHASFNGLSLLLISVAPQLAK
jgi:membrane protease YdiL (CAAX protease family)